MTRAKEAKSSDVRSTHREKFYTGSISILLVFHRFTTATFGGTDEVPTKFGAEDVGANELNEGKDGHVEAGDEEAGDGGGHVLFPLMVVPQSEVDDEEDQDEDGLCQP